MPHTRLHGEIPTGGGGARCRSSGAPRLPELLQNRFGFGRISYPIDKVDYTASAVSGNLLRYSATRGSTLRGFRAAEALEGPSLICQVLVARDTVCASTETTPLEGSRGRSIALLSPRALPELSADFARPFPRPRFNSRKRTRSDVSILPYETTESNVENNTRGSPLPGMRTRFTITFIYRTKPGWRVSRYGGFGGT